MACDTKISHKVLDFFNGDRGSLAYFSIDYDYLQWVTGKNDPDSITELIAFCESICNPCFIELGDLTRFVPALAQHRRIVKQDDSSITHKIFFNTAIGEKGWVLKQMKGSQVERISESVSAPVASREDFGLFEWFRDEVKKADWSTAFAEIKKTASHVQGRALLTIFLVPPFELLYWTKRDEMFLLYFDYPGEYHKAMDMILEAYDNIMAIAKKAGIQIVVYGAPGGTEFTSPTIWKEAIVPTSARFEAMARKHGLYTTFHCCGKVKTILSAGFANQICPTIWETLSPPPVGDIVNLSEARSQLSKDIITHGNLDITMLRDSSVSTIVKKAMEIREETCGFKHIIGASDGCVWPHTPPDNLRAVCETLNSR